METNDIRQMFEAGTEQLKKLHDIVTKIIHEEDLIVNNLKNPPQ